jgi:hypothetical protein
LARYGSKETQRTSIRGNKAMNEEIQEQIVQRLNLEEKTEKELLRLLNRVCWNNREELKKLIEKLMDLHEHHLHEEPKKESAFWYWSGKTDVWDKIFQALMGN